MLPRKVSVLVVKTSFLFTMVSANSLSSRQRRSLIGFLWLLCVCDQCIYSFTMSDFPIDHSSFLLLLCEKCPYSELFWSSFTRIWTEYREIWSISPYSVRMRENVGQNNFECGHFLRSDAILSILIMFTMTWNGWFWWRNYSCIFTESSVFKNFNCCFLTQLGKLWYYFVRL